ncbi:MAG: cysteine--tRNA ligase [Candidatus Micrarchaeia archaeon]
MAAKIKPVTKGSKGKILLFNTMGRKLERFVPIEKGVVRMYSCGPTVYSYPHMGNMFAYVFVDILRRTLEYNKYKVINVRNITDVGHLTSQADAGEDKMEKEAQKEHKTAYEIAKFYEDAFFRYCDTLNCLRPAVSPRATEHIKEMISLVGELEKKGYTYQIEDGIYYDSSKFKNYGALTGMSFEQLNHYLIFGERVETVPGKKHVTDFALWKFSPKGVKRQMEWDSPWGVGFPGWHIECSAMSMKYLGNTFDIHTGGVDHIPIHHTNEIAQSEGATGKKFVNYWMHNEFVLVDGKKMAKSTGNFFTLDDLLNKGYTWREIRYLLISVHYRSQPNITDKSLEGARGAVKRLSDFIARLNSAESTKPNDDEARRAIKEAKDLFIKSINTDLNMPEALKAVFVMVNAVNKLIDRKALSKRGAKAVLKALLAFDSVMGLKLDEFANMAKGKLDPVVEKLIKLRKEARKNGNYALADEIRKRLKDEYRIDIEDAEGGEVIKRLDLT